MIEFEAVRALPALRAYDDRELAVLLGSSAEREYARGEVIFESGKRSYACVLVVSGEVEVLRSGSERETPIRRYGPGMFLGQTSLVDGRPRTTTVRALTRVVGLEFTRDVFEALLRAQPARAALSTTDRGLGNPHASPRDRAADGASGDRSEIS